MLNRIVSRSSFLVAALSVVAAVGVYNVLPAYAQDQGGNAPAGGQGPVERPGERQGGPGERPGGRGPNLEGAMKQAERSYKALARQLDDATKDEQSLRAISMLQAGLATSKGLVPHIIEEKPEAERPAALAEYRKILLDTLKIAIDLEEKLVAGDRAGAKADLEKLHAQQEEGHKKFAPEDDH